MKRTIELTLEQAKEFYNKGGELKEIALLAYTENELLDNKKNELESYIRTILRLAETTPIQKLSYDHWREFWSIEHSMSIIYGIIEYFLDFWHRDYNWDLISSCQILTEDFIIEYYDTLNIELILLHQQHLSQETIDKIIEKTKNDSQFWDNFWKHNCHYVNIETMNKLDKGWNVRWNLISKYPKLSLDFIKEFKTKLDLDVVMQYNQMAQQTTKVNDLVGQRFVDEKHLREKMQEIFGTDEVSIGFVDVCDKYIDDSLVVSINNIGLDITLYYILTKANYLYITETYIEEF